MNMEDFARINRILNSYEPQTPGIKIINSKRRSSLTDDFKNDLKLFNYCGGYKEVERVLIYGECFLAIQLRDNGTPLIYYFTTCFGDVGLKLVEIRKICEEFNVPVDEMDESLV